jgi:hypothetical protein
MRLNPETAAKVALILFPELDAQTGLAAFLDWFASYELKYREFTLSDPSGFKQILELRKADPESELEMADSKVGVRNNPAIKQMMRSLLDHARKENLSAVQLSEKVGASYPTILNWQRGKLPRGENIKKVRSYLAKHQVA